MEQMEWRLVWKAFRNKVLEEIQTQQMRVLTVSGDSPEAVTVNFLREQGKWYMLQQVIPWMEEVEEMDLTEEDTDD